MPPASSQYLTKNELTDWDVAILHEIVASAVQDADVATYPFRAIYRAYEDVLAHHGLKKERDSTFLRFLFRLRIQQRPDQTLYESFEALLSEHGIQIEISNSEDISYDDGDYTIHSIIPTSPTEDNVQFSRRSRRASLDDLQELRENEPSRSIMDRPGSRASYSQVPLDTEPLLPAQYDGLPRVRTARANGHATVLSRGMRSASKPLETHGEHASDEFESYLRRPAVSNASRSHPSGSIRTTSADRSSPRSRRDSAPHGAYHDGGTESSDLRKAYNPSRTQLLRDAEVVERYRLQAISRRFLGQWYERTQTMIGVTSDLHQQAIGHDQGILARQALETWHGVYLQKKQARVTEKYFEQLEQHHTKEYENHLKAKALSHWSQCSAEEIGRTTLARKHIALSSIFKVWHSLTLADKTKIRQISLAKTLHAWRARLYMKLAQIDVADKVADRGFVRKVYWNWFWIFCEERAPQWRSLKLRQRYLSLLTVKLRAVEAAKDATVLRAAKSSQLHIFERWKSQSLAFAVDDQRADELSRKQQLGNAFLLWRRQARYKPIAEKASGMVDWRIAETTFATVVLRTRISRQAKVVDAKRIALKAWTAWNDRLRWMTMVRQIDNRVAVACLYNWVLVEREVLMSRLHDERILDWVFRKMLQQRRRRKGPVRENMAVCEGFRRRNLLYDTLSSWTDRTASVGRHEQIADVRYKPHALLRVTAAMKEKMQYRQQLNVWSKDAAFFFTSSRTMRVWKSAVEISQKQKRHDAYVLMRRRIKISLCKSVISQWQHSTTNYAELDTEAERIRKAKKLTLTVYLLERWRRRLSDVDERDYQARMDHDRCVAELCLALWLQRSLAQRDLTRRVAGVDRVQAERVAYHNLKKLHLKVLEIQSHAGKAIAVHNWNERRHLRGLLRIWLESALARRGPSQHDVEMPSTRARRIRFTPARIGNDEDRDRLLQGSDMSAINLPSTTPGPPFPQTPPRRFDKSSRTPLASAIRPVPATATPSARMTMAGPSSLSRFGRSMNTGIRPARVNRSLFDTIHERTSFP